MASLLLSSAAPLLTVYSNNYKKKNQQFLCLNNQRYHHSKLLVCGVSSSLNFNPLTLRSSDSRYSFGKKSDDSMAVKNRRGNGTVCYAGNVLTAPRYLHWVSAICSAVLMLAKGTSIYKSFLVPLFALQAPAAVISWIKGEYGIWTVFLALLVRLFFFIPVELELPFMALLFVIIAPYQVLNLRGRQEGAIIALVIVAYLAFQHFSRVGNLQRAFDQGSIVATLAIIGITAVSCFLLV